MWGPTRTAYLYEEEEGKIQPWRQGGGMEDGFPLPTLAQIC